MICSQGKELKVLQSAAGYYIGTTDDSDGFEEPYCRCSGYIDCIETADDSLHCGDWQERNCVENNYCNLGKGCKC